MKLYKWIILIGLLVLNASCGAYFNQPLSIQKARLGESTEVTKNLKKLPPAENKVVVGVYDFRDLTGQYEKSTVGSTFSTAVTQGATAILIKALDDSDWFIPIERANIGNLLNERNIIRSTRQQYRGNPNQKAPQVAPLLYAGIILEGGIVSYDYNIITGGFGARYFGIGGSTQYRQDRVTIYLRAVSTKNGKILENVYVSKTILSQAVDASLFRYVKFKRLLEVETGFTRNEPVQLAVTAAIEKAVYGLIMEGMQDGLWQPKGGEFVARELISKYENEKVESNSTKLFDREYFSRQRKNSIGANFGGALLSGDYSDKEFGFYAQLDYSRSILPFLSLNIAVSSFELSNGILFNQGFFAGDLNAQFRLLPHDKLSPFLYGGTGFLMPIELDKVAEDNFGGPYLKVQYGLGLEYMLSEKWGILLRAEHNLVFTDEVDLITQGTRNDHYFDFSLGFNFYFGKKTVKNKNKPQN